MTTTLLQDRPISCWAEARSTSLEIALAISQIATKRFEPGTQEHLAELQKIWESRDPYRMSAVLERAFQMAPHLVELHWGVLTFELWGCDVDSLEARFKP